MDEVQQAQSVLGYSELRRLEHTHAHCTPSLMERAGCAAAQYALELLASHAGCVLVLAGPGNNGGDAYVLARELLQRGVNVVLASLAEPASLPSDAAQAHASWLAAGGQVFPDFIGRQWSLVVDGLFGIGLKRPIEGMYAEWIARVNAMTCPVLALDVPSGLDAENGRVVGPVVQASHTASFIALKPGLLTLDGPDHCGELRLFDLGLKTEGLGGQTIAPACFAKSLQPRPHNVHKGSFGSAGIIGGAAGMTGAGILAARAALRLGAGKVLLGLLEAPGFTFDPQYPELMLRQPGDLHLLATALAIGPGLGVSDAASQHLRRAMAFSGPVVLDADALNLLAENPALQTLLTQRQPGSVMTPHPAEAARLARTSVAEVQADRVDCAVELAARFKACVVLKGCGSIVATPEGRWYINTSGNSGMATAGMGDVLTGLILALLAQRWTPAQATLAAVHLHGVAADRLVATGQGPVGLCAGETIDAARAVFNTWLKS
ncbi:bifunctional ADP-dependent NAD(P)H-hydrate dehydratase/NAD(P)H-hydrate epimerase [Uliginosibacterium gangwonense]|uniref:bifunctional ADP-dependent NAD(P)H-hydrate dehydratase/NAD(P)H-hydrate epimerase n=1 Tax=Uliginosibacterium gangwonense TaxID=392736 RepID=UPI000361B154|nr:bifunctional ADP-dependent NAD(P)H-hydrate dehydratase/NAD(P)H-hydrate epimerase [Uliginosibacterium gangwonense]